MGKYDDIKKELKDLIKEGLKLVQSFYDSDDETSTYFFLNYEIWYSKALIVIKLILPERIEDFIELYKPKKRKGIDVSTYSISDALRNISHTFDNFSPETAMYPMLQQYKILESCEQILESQICNLQVILQADIFDSEIESAKHLLKMGFLRPSGAICGVVLEKHFSSVAKKREIWPKRKKNATISDFNDLFKDEEVYDIIEWRRIQHLGDLRNLCDHNKDREPTKEEIEELISGTEHAIKTIF